MICKKIHWIILISFILLTQAIFSQTEKEPRWYQGDGFAQGTDINEMRIRAFNSARADALKKAGIIIRATDVSLKTETNQTLTDFFTQFAESNTRGLILDERNVKVSHPIPISGTADEFSSSYQIKVSLEALVAIQIGEPDPGFEVRLESNRESYSENEPVFLTITSTRSGFLTIFSIENDSLTLIFPNAIMKNDSIKEYIPVYFPPSSGYNLTLQTITGQKKSEITFVAVVSKDKFLFLPIEESKYEGKNLKLRQAMLTHYANWLYKIPVNQRSSDIKAVQVFKKEKE